MIMWLDHKIFGNGHGLRTPAFDGVFYWLNGEFYTWSHGLGAQLTSFQWTHPRAGERRKLSGRDYVVFDSTRRGPRVRVSWALVGLGKLSLDDAHRELREAKKTLGNCL